DRLGAGSVSRPPELSMDFTLSVGRNLSFWTKSLERRVARVPNCAEKLRYSYSGRQLVCRRYEDSCPCRALFRTLLSTVGSSRPPMIANGINKTRNRRRMGAIAVRRRRSGASTYVPVLSIANQRFDIELGDLPGRPPQIVLFGSSHIN